MRITGMMSLVVVVLAASIALADEAPKLVNERLLFGAGGERVHTGLFEMRIARGGKYLLFLKATHVGTRRNPADGEPQEMWWPYLHVRDLATGADRELPEIGLGTAQVLPLDGGVHPSGEKILLMHSAVSEGPEAPKGLAATIANAQVFQCDLATGKMETTGLAPTYGDSSLPLYDSSGNGLVVTTFGPEPPMEVLTTSLASPKPKRLDASGWCLAVCPAADVVAMQRYFPHPGGGYDTKFVLYDYVNDKQVEVLTSEPHGLSGGAIPVLWTEDGRYLCYLVSKEGEGGGPSPQAAGMKLATAIWNRVEHREAARLEGCLPLGRGPTPTTVLLARGMVGESWTELVLYDAAAGSTWPLKEGVAGAICGEGRHVVYAKAGKDGKPETYIAEIAMPGGMH